LCTACSCGDARSSNKPRHLVEGNGPNAKPVILRTLPCRCHVELLNVHHDFDIIIKAPCQDSKSNFVATPARAVPHESWHLLPKRSLRLQHQAGNTALTYCGQTRNPARTRPFSRWPNAARLADVGTLEHCFKSLTIFRTDQDPHLVQKRTPL